MRRRRRLQTLMASIASGFPKSAFLPTIPVSGGTALRTALNRSDWPRSFGFKGYGGTSAPAGPSILFFAIDAETGSVLLEANQTVNVTATLDFHSTNSPVPAKGAGDIATFSYTLEPGLNDDTIDFSPYAGETGFLIARITVGDEDSPPEILPLSIASAAFTPASLGAKLLGWISPNDLAALWTAPDGARTNNVAADNDDVFTLDDKSGNGNHLVDAGAAIKYRTAAGDSWFEFPGAATAYLTAEAGSLSGAGLSDAIVWMRLRTVDDRFMMVSASAAGDWIGAVWDGNTGNESEDNVPIEVDGTLFSGSRDGLHAVVSTGSWVTVAIVGANLTSPNYDLGFNLLNYWNNTTDWHYAGDALDFVITTNDLTAQEKSDLEAWFAAGASNG